MFGITLGFLSTLSMAARELLSKRLAAEVTGTASAFATFLFALPWYVLVWAIVTGFGIERTTVSHDFWFWIVLRSLSDVGAEWTKMVALSYGDVSTVLSLLALTPVVLLVLSPVLTGDPLRGSAIVGILVIVIGSVMAARIRSASVPDGAKCAGHRRTIGFALASTVFFALNNCFDRMAVQTGAPVFSGMTMTLFSGIALAPFALRKSGNREGLRASASVLNIRGFFEVLFMSLRLSALTVLSAPVMAGIQRSALIWTIVGGRVFFGETHTGRRLFAACIILVGTMLLLYGELFR